LQLQISASDFIDGILLLGILYLECLSGTISDNIGISDIYKYTNMYTLYRMTDIMLEEMIAI